MRKALFAFIAFLFLWPHLAGAQSIPFGSVPMPHSAGGVATPTFIQHVDIDQFGIGGSNITQLVIRLPNPTLAGNTVVVAVGNGTTSSPTSITDDAPGGTDSYNLVKSQTDSGNTYNVSVYTAQNVKAGARKITINLSTTSYVSAKATEFAGIATSGAVDATNGTTATNSTITGGSITPTQTGDLLYQVGFQDSASPPAATSFTKGSQSNITWAFIPGSVQIWDGSYAQYGVYNSTSAINPTLTTSTSNNYVSIGLALKAATAGALPSAGIRVAAVQHLYLQASSSQATQFVSSGNLQLLLSTSTDGITYPGGITSTNGTWTRRVAAHDTQDAAYGEIWDAANVTAGTQTVTIGFKGSNDGHDVMFLDVLGAATAPYDTSITIADPTPQTSGSTLIYPTSITPTTSNGLIVTCAPVDLGELLDLTTGYSVTGTTTPVDTDSHLDENNGYGIYYNPSTSAVQFIWSETTQVNYWSAGAAAYKAP